MREAHFSSRAARPLVTQYVVTLDTSANGKGASLVLDPTSLQVTDKNAFCCDLPSRWGRWENGWWWWFDWSTGSVYRQHGNLYAPRDSRDEVAAGHERSVPDLVRPRRRRGLGDNCPSALRLGLNLSASSASPQASPALSRRCESNERRGR